MREITAQEFAAELDHWMDEAQNGPILITGERGEGFVFISAEQWHAMVEQANTYLNKGDDNEPA